MIQDWDIKPRGQECHGCKTAFDDHQRCHSVLEFGQEGYSRGDYCGKCWEEKAKVPSRFSAWSGIFKKPPPAAEEPLKKENAEELLRRLMETEDPSKRNVIYILAIMLERKRILVEKDVKTRDDGVMIRVYEHKKTGETFLVPDPRLGFDQLTMVQQEVADMLGMSPKKGPAGPKTETVAAGASVVATEIHDHIAEAEKTEEEADDEELEDDMDEDEDEDIDKDDDEDEDEFRDEDEDEDKDDEN
jgi:hypothetical protein